MFESSDFESLVNGEIGCPSVLAERLYPELNRQDKALLIAAMICREAEADDFSVTATADAQVLENLIGDLAGGPYGKCGVLLSHEEVEAIADASGEPELMTVKPAIYVDGEPRWLRDEVLKCLQH